VKGKFLIIKISPVGVQFVLVLFLNFDWRWTGKSCAPRDLF